MKRFTKILPLLLCGVLLCGCTEPNKNAGSEMIYVKSVSLYDTIVEIYGDPEAHVGETYHMVGTLYPSQDDDGETFYSIYAEPQGGEKAPVSSWTGTTTAAFRITIRSRSKARLRSSSGCITGRKTISL